MRLAILTTGRQDWGLFRPLCDALRSVPSLSFEIYAGGMACSEAFGRVVDTIRRQGYPVAEELVWDCESENATHQASRALDLVGGVLRRRRPESLVVLGDRYETAAAALSATVQGVPIVHLYGGEESEGAIDNALRHAITKMSHLHLVAHSVYRDRVVQMGEDPSAVHIVGSLGVDNAFQIPPLSRESLEAYLGIKLAPPLGLVTVHPTTLRGADEPSEVEAVIGAIRACSATWVVTLPNSDPGHEEIRAALLSLAEERPRVVAVPALGEERYLGVMRLADFVLGNSSSAIVEAPSLRVPTINVGDRQRGRVRSQSVLDVDSRTDAILGAISKALSPDWRASIVRQPLPFGDGRAAEKIAGVLKEWTPPNPPRKIFRSVESVVGEGEMPHYGGGG